MGHHSYTLGCTCPRCTKEAIRRNAQSLTDPRRKFTAAKPKRTRRKPQHRPIPGSQEWAETYSDDLGDSPDY